MVRSESPFKTYQDLVKAAKDKPGSLNVGGSALNSANPAWRTSAGVRPRVSNRRMCRFQRYGRYRFFLAWRSVDAAMSYVTLAINQKGKTRMLAIATEKTPPAVSGYAHLQGTLASIGSMARIAGMSVPKSTPEDIRKNFPPCSQK